MECSENEQLPDRDEQIAMLKEKLAEAQKFAALGQLLGTTTHEFNNVLMSVINYAKMGMRHKDEATRDKSFEKILSAGQRAARISKSILAVARNRGNTFEPTNLVKLVEDSLVLLEREMNKYRIAVETDFQEVPEAMLNGNQIQQVVLNLLINARQAMPNGGRVIIRILYDSANDMVDFVVRDTGTGIDPEKLPKIFDSYYTTKSGPDESGKGGTGLGLSSCRDIVEAHQGRIRVQSTLGKGTAFTIKLPVAREPVSDSPQFVITSPAKPQSAAS